jgi:hypothetical protein
MVNAATVEIRPELVDRMIELYCDWRTECAVVQAAYARFCRAQPPDRTAAFAAYEAALDREESACESYAAQIRAIESQFTAAGPVGRPQDDRQPR